MRLARAQGRRLRPPVQLLPPVRRLCWMELYLVRMPLYLVRMQFYLVGEIASQNLRILKMQLYLVGRIPLYLVGGILAFV